MKFIHAADLHLDSPLSGLDRYDGAPVDQIRNATRQALVRLVDLALTESVDLVLLAGDLYDGDWKDYNTGLFFLAQINRLRETGTRVFLITGNHDAASQITRELRLPPHVRKLSERQPETVPLDDLNVAIHGQGFAQRAVPHNLAAAYPDPVPGLFNIGLLHTSATGRPGHESYAPCTVEDLLAKGYEYWALGHVHAREVLHENPWIIFPGNTQGRHIRETGPKGCSLVTVSARSAAATVQHIDLDVLRWSVLNLDATPLSTPDELLEQVRLDLLQLRRTASDRPCAVRVVLKGIPACHADLVRSPEKWTNEIRAAASNLGGIWIEKVLFHTGPRMNWSDLAADDPLGQLVRCLDQIRADPAQFDAFAAELADVKKKLLPEYRERELPFPLDDPAQRENILLQTRQLLLARLLPAPAP